MTLMSAIWKYICQMGKFMCTTTCLTNISFLSLSMSYQSILKFLGVMHQSAPSANIPAGQPPGFCTYFQPGSRDLYHLNCPGVALGSDLLSIIKIPSCQLMPQKALSSFKLICHLLLLSCYKICFKAGEKL